MTGNRRENRRQPTLEELEKRTGKQRSGETEETEETKEQENRGTGKQRNRELGTGKASNQFSETEKWESSYSIFRYLRTVELRRVMNLLAAERSSFGVTAL